MRIFCHQLWNILKRTESHPFPTQKAVTMNIHLKFPFVMEKQMHLSFSFGTHKIKSWCT